MLTNSYKKARNRGCFSKNIITSCHTCIYMWQALVENEESLFGPVSKMKIELTIVTVLSINYSMISRKIEIKTILCASKISCCILRGEKRCIKDY